MRYNTNQGQGQGQIAGDRNQSQGSIDTDPGRRTDNYKDSAVRIDDEPKSSSIGGGRR